MFKQSAARPFHFMADLRIPEGASTPADRKIGLCITVQQPRRSFESLIHHAPIHSVDEIFRRSVQEGLNQV